MKNTFKIWHWTARENFGDVLNSVLFNELLDAKFELTKDKYKTDCIFIGSILSGFQNKMLPFNMLKYFYPKLMILGVGFRDVPLRKPFKRRLDIRMLRGELTKAEVLKLGYKLPEDLVLGDPGLLANTLLKKEVKKTHKVGFIPHFTDLDTPEVKKILSENPDMFLINILDDVDTVIEQVASCESILASAMHGLILADSLGIPNMWAENLLKDKKTEPRFKFKDYYSALGVTDIEPVAMVDFKPEDVDRIKSDYKVDYEVVKAKQQELLTKLKEVFECK